SGGNLSIGPATLTGAMNVTTVNGGLTFTGSSTSNTIFGQTSGGSAGDITINNGVTLTGHAAASPLVLAPGHNFVNNGNSGALSTPSGRWLVYSTQYSADTIGGLVESFHRFNCTYGGSCPAFPGAGNGFLYVLAPNLTITPVTLSNITYGAAV